MSILHSGKSELDTEHCHRCLDNFSTDENIISIHDELYHPSCFVCSQCFRPLSNEEFFQFEGRRYCKYDFKVLFASCCHKCGECILSKLIKAAGHSWHPECLNCENCGGQLLVKGFQKLRNRILCKDCCKEEQKLCANLYICYTCHKPIEEGRFIQYFGEHHHPYHFNCVKCEEPIGIDGIERSGEMYCFKCFIKLGVPICAACRRPVESRIVWALGKAWHSEHFVCQHCEVPFMGGRFYEHQGRAYCLVDYQRRIGNTCQVCSKPVTGVLATFTNKTYCPEHFKCSACDKLLDEKTKLYEIDLKPVCNDCYSLIPLHWKRVLAKIHIAGANEK